MRYRSWEAAGAAVVVAVLIGTGAFTWSTLTSADYVEAYSGTGSFTVAELDLCGAVTLSATVTARAARSQPDVSGWRSVQVADIVSEVHLTDCATGKSTPLDRLRVYQTWSETSCSMDAAGAPVAEAETDGGADGSDQALVDAPTWLTRTSYDPCPRRRTAVQVSANEGESSLTTTSTGLDLGFAGRAWLPQLCLSPGIVVEATRGIDSVSSRAVLPEACLQRQPG